MSKALVEPQAKRMVSLQRIGHFMKWPIRNSSFLGFKEEKTTLSAMVTWNEWWNYWKLKWLQCSPYERKPPCDQANLFFYFNLVYCLFQELHSSKTMPMYSWSIYPSSREKRNSREEFSGRTKWYTRRSLIQFASKWKFNQVLTNTFWDGI